MSQAELDRHWAEFTEAARDELRRARREHLLHQLGVALIWLGGLAVLFEWVYSLNRAVGQATALIWAGIALPALIGGAVLGFNNRHQRDRGEY